jgi:hypothetical protein
VAGGGVAIFRPSCEATIAFINFCIGK